MARPKQIEDQVLLDLIKRYFNEVCNENPKKLKAVDIAKYINKNGYPDYPVTTLRRTPAAMEYIESLKKSLTDDAYIKLVSYQTIDAEQFLRQNRSHGQLVKALTELDCYYKTVADSAIIYMDKYHVLYNKYETVKRENEVLTEKNKELESLNKSYNGEKKTLKFELEIYKSIVDTYVYPEIANELLIKEGALRKTKTPLKDNVLKDNIITPTTDIKKIAKTAKSESNVIQGLFDKFDDDDE